MPLFLENDGNDIAFSLIYKFCKNVLQSCSGCFRYHGKLGIETVTDQIRQLASEDIAVPDALIIISIISVFYNQFRDNAYIAVALQVMRAGVAAVIFDVVLGLAGNIFRTKSILWIGLMAAAFAATCFFNVSAVVIILICGTVGLLQIKHEERKEERL